MLIGLSAALSRKCTLGARVMQADAVEGLRYSAWPTLYLAAYQAIIE
jgi:hypothetical protein